MVRAVATPCPCVAGPPPTPTAAPPLHRGAPAPDAEAAIRSRYSAYVLGLADYLRATWHASTRPAMLDLDDDKRGLA